MTFDATDMLKIVLAVFFGGLIGLEREFRDKAAGFRTLIFICLGATLFTILSSQLAGDKDPTRIAASIVSGVGFLGAGVILLPIKSLVQTMMASQTLNGVLLPVILIVMLRLVNDRRLMGRFVNGRLLNILTYATVAILIALTVILLITTLFPGFLGSG